MIYIKKFFIVFVCMILMSFAMVSSAFASFPSSYLGNSNIFDENNTLNAFYPSQGTQPLYYVELEGNTSYTFVAPSGSDRFICSPVVENVPGAIQPYIFDYESTNLYTGTDKSGSITNVGSQRFVLVYRVYETGTYYLNFDYNFSKTITVDLLLQGDNDLYFSGLTGTRGNFNTSVNISSLGSNGYSVFYVILTSRDSNTTYNVSNIYFSHTPMSRYYPGWAKPFYVDGYIQTYTFNTGLNGGGTYAIGFKDSMLENNDNFFSRYQAANSKFYLLKADLNFDSIYEEYYNNGYSSGYESGFGVGETSGLEASGMLRNVIFTIFSVPFVFIRNALDFEILGINFKNIVLVLLSASLVAWVIRTFKKGE